MAKSLFGMNKTHLHTFLHQVIEYLEQRNYN